jgi:ABC-type Fe3+ transport system substrate-binding protein
MRRIRDHRTKESGILGPRLGGVARGALLAAGLILSGALAPGAAAQSGSDFDKQWAELIAAAKKEGTLVLTTGSIPNFSPIFEAFTKEFGVTVTTDGGSGSSRATRILAERNAGRFTVDAGLISVAGSTRRLVPAGAVVPVKPLLIHPDLTDTSKWYGNRHWYVDRKSRDKVFVFSARAENYWRFWYNTKKLTAKDVASIKTPSDILDPKWKGKLSGRSWSDPGRLGGMLDMYFAPDAGPEWIVKYFKEMDVKFTSDTRLEESWLFRGSYPLKWKEGNIQDVLLKYQHKFPIKPVDLPRQRGKLEARGSECCIVVFDKAPHPKAAQLFVNWILTKKVQTMIHMTKPSPAYTTLRTDGVPAGNTSPVYRRIAGKEYWFRDFDDTYRDREREARKFIVANYQGPKETIEVHMGKVVETKRAGRRVTIDFKGQKVTAKLSSSKTKVTVAGKAAKRKNVKVGMTCTFTYPGPNTTAKKVDCK